MCPSVSPNKHRFDVELVDCGEVLRYICRRGNYTGQSVRSDPIVDEEEEDIDLELQPKPGTGGGYDGSLESGKLNFSVILNSVI